MATNAGQSLNQEGCVMTLEELVAKIKTLGSEVVSSIDLWAIDAELWIGSGMKNLFGGNIMQLTIGQVAFTVIFAFALGWRLLDWYLGLRDFFFPDANTKDNP